MKFFDKSTSLNIVLMAGIQGAEYIAPLIVLPHLFRKLGADFYGSILFVQAACVFLQIFVDFGYNFTGVRDVAVNKSNKNKLSDVYWGVLIWKIIFFGIVCLISLVFFLITYDSNSRFAPLFFIALLQIVGSIAYPVWFMQGLGLLKATAYVSVSVKLTFAFLVLIFVNGAGDQMLACFLTSVSGLCVGIFCNIYIYKNKYIRYVFPSMMVLKAQFFSGLAGFPSLLMSSVYRSANPVILGALAGTESVAYYSAVEKIIKACQELNRPISMVMLPKVSEAINRSLNDGLVLIYKSFFLISLVGLATSITIFFLKDYISIYLTGFVRLEVLNILSILFLIPLVGGVNSVFGVMTLIPLKREYLFARFIFFSACANIVLIYFLAPKYGSIGAAFSYLASEILLLLQLLFFFKKKFRGVNNE